MDVPAIGIVLAELDGTGEGAGVAMTGQEKNKRACNLNVVLCRKPTEDNETGQQRSMQCQETKRSP